ncbi:MAG: nucleoside-diphosphate sugar epimerase/dehydratase [Mariprofundaceae bacterium]|nr:nucleoside-diphosphate sugar epimerase/dehydratase [Mariprofundaceae bacterium]
MAGYTRPPGKLSFRWQSPLLVLLHDLAWVPVAIVLAFWGRFNFGVIPNDIFSGMLWLLVVMLPVQGAVFYFSGLYRGIWRFASLPDLIRILKAVGGGMLIGFALLFVLQRLEGVPRSALVLYPLFLTIGLALPRLLYRWWKDRSLHLSMNRKRALIIGAGTAGEQLMRELLKSGPYDAVGFLDDADRRQGQEVHGVRVIGVLADLEKVIRSFAVDVVLLAIPTAPRQLVQRISEQCRSMDVPCRILPSLAELADGRVTVSQLREVTIEDVLGREAIELDNAAIADFLRGKRILVTGAGGSIGSELCRQIAHASPEKLIMLEQSELNLYNIEQELCENGDAMSGAITTSDYALVLGDVRDANRMQWLFEEYRPQVVFHAAAYKHVPLVEENPAEGAKTNLLGTAKIADLAVKYGVEKMLLVSTDKAVNPANVMGATKRAAEIYCQNLDARSADTAFITTRFGNVLGSTGSVVPKFRKQIAEGGPVTVTHPEMTRYFMTIPEAVILILQAGAMGAGGEIFVLDMGEPVKIIDLAEQMIRLSGLQPGEDIEIVYSGLRPGEKMYEELFYQSEKLQPTTHAKIMLARSQQVAWDEFVRQRQALELACAQRDLGEVHRLLRSMVPEYRPDAADSAS